MINKTTEKYLNIMNHIRSNPAPNLGAVCKKFSASQAIPIQLIKLGYVRRDDNGTYIWRVNKPSITMANALQKACSEYTKNLPSKQAGYVKGSRMVKAPKSGVVKRGPRGSYKPRTVETPAPTSLSAKTSELVKRSGNKVSAKLSMTEQQAIEVLKGCAHCTYEIYRTERIKL